MASNRTGQPVTGPDATDHEDHCHHDQGQEEQGHEGHGHGGHSHDLHAWTLTSNLPILSTQVVVEGRCFGSGHAPQILDSLQACLGEHFDVGHSTFQLEPASHSGHEPGKHP